MEYKVSLDKLAKLITVATSILFLLIIAAQLFSMSTTVGHHSSLLVTLGLLLAYAVVFAFRPISYDTNDGTLVIRRLVKNVTFSRATIKSVELIDSKLLGGAFHTFGVGGLFGYFGYFTNRTLGNMIWYATRRSKAVLIITSTNKKIILTPDEPEAFVSNMQR